MTATAPETLPASPTKREPKGTTTTDLMVLVAGLALGWVLPRPGIMWFLGISNPVVLAFIGFGFLMLLTGFALTLVVLARRVRYGGLPRPAEWLAILIGLHLLNLSIPNVDTAVNWIYSLRGSTAIDFSLLRWCWAGADLVVVAICLALLAIGRRALPDWARTLLLTVAALALMWGPIPVAEVERLGLDRLLPVSSPKRMPEWRLELSLRARTLLSETPGALLLGVPMMATVLGWRKRKPPGRVWTEWAGASTMALLAVWHLAWNCMEFIPVDTAHLVRLVTWVLWLVAVALLSRFLVRRCDAAWTRWLAAGPGPSEQPA